MEMNAGNRFPQAPSYELSYERQDQVGQRSRVNGIGLQTRLSNYPFSLRQAWHWCFNGAMQAALYCLLGVPGKMLPVRSEAQLRHSPSPLVPFRSLRRDS